MKEHTGKQGFAALCMSLFFIFLFSGSALFTAQLAQNIQEVSLRSRFCDDTSLACGLLNPPEQFHLQRGNPTSKTGLRTQPFYGAAGGNSAALPGSDSVSCSFRGIPPQPGFPSIHPFPYETLSRQSRPRILKKQKEHSAISVQKTALQEQLYINSEYPETEHCFRKERNHHGCMVHASHSVRGFCPARTLCFTGRFSDINEQRNKAAQ